MKNEDEAVLEWGRQDYVMGRLEEREQWEIKTKMAWGIFAQSDTNQTLFWKEM